jgi:hypothetical protein
LFKFPANLSIFYECFPAFQEQRHDLSLVSRMLGEAAYRVDDAISSVLWKPPASSSTPPSTIQMILPTAEEHEHAQSSSSTSSSAPTPGSS